MIRYIMKKHIILGMVLFTMILMTGCNKEEKTSPIVGAWAYESEVYVRTIKGNPSVSDTTVHVKDRTIIREFKKEGTVFVYKEAIIPMENITIGGCVWDNYIDIWDWKLSDDGRTLFLSNGRNNKGVKIGYTDHTEEILTLNDNQLVTKYTWEDEKSTFANTSTYQKQKATYQKQKE